MRPRVLVVDDVPANVALIRAVLGVMACEIVSATSGSEALALLRQGDFAFLLIDVQMPEMDGFELAAHVRSNSTTRDTAIVFLTAGDGGAQDVAKAYALGAIDFLFKPIDRNVLRGKTQALIELYVGRRQLADARDALEHSNEELRTAYQQLAATQQQLIQAAKMASMGTLVAGIAHEINTPLAYVIGHLATVTRALKPTGPDGTPADGPRDWALIQKRFLGMQLGLDRIHTLVRELLTFSRLDPGEYRFVNVPECIAAVLETLRHRLAGRIHVETRFGTPEGIQCNPQLLQQGVLNLLANGIDAIESEGTIEVTCMAERDDYVIRVTDNGHGIPVSIRDRVMEPFFTTRPVGTGTGLGLPVTYSLVLGHGGTLELLDGKSGGTEAVIRIPLSNVSQ
jgi:two-component system, NtrC family, sensor kinase